MTGPPPAGATGRNRTDNLRITSAPLCQLSYGGSLVSSIKLYGQQLNEASMTLIMWRLCPFSRCGSFPSHAFLSWTRVRAGPPLVGAECGPVSGNEKVGKEGRLVGAVAGRSPATAPTRRLSILAFSSPKGGRAPLSHKGPGKQSIRLPLKSDQPTSIVHRQPYGYPRRWAVVVRAYTSAPTKRIPSPNV